MTKGLYLSTMGMTTQMKRMDVVSNNLANVDTTGYKKDAVITSSFPEELFKRLDDPALKTNADFGARVGKMSLGLNVNKIFTEFTQGAMQKTDDKLNVAIAGKGFLTIGVADEKGNVVEKYSRDGSFTKSSEGMLMTKEGNRVMGQNGPITLPDGEVEIDAQGRILVNGELVDTLKVVNVENPDSLRKTGDNLYDVTEQTQTSGFSGKVVQGYLEASNVNTVREMVDMITISRAYEANQKMIQTADQTLGRAVNDIARK